MIWSVFQALCAPKIALQCDRKLAVGWVDAGNPTSSLIEGDRACCRRIVGTVALVKSGSPMAQATP
jgi:hypothetical protein